MRKPKDRRCAGTNARLHLMLMVAVLLLMLPRMSQADATTVTDYVTFEASGFSGVGAVGAAPTDPVNGSFTITFDPTLTYPDTTAGISLDSLNITLDSTLGFNYTPASGGDLTVGGTAGGVDSVGSGTNDFLLDISAFTTGPTMTELYYSSPVAGPEGGWESVTGTVTVVPLPGSVLLFGSGLLGLMGARLRNRWRKGPHRP